MEYSISEITKMMKIYHEFESSARDYLFLASFGMKHKEKVSSSAKKLIAAIAEYRKLPSDIRNELEKDKESNVSKIDELDKVCKIKIV